MGIDVDAILFYGYCWKEESAIEVSSEEWAYDIARDRGHKNPWDEFPESEYGALPYPAKKPFLDEWLAKHDTKPFYNAVKEIEKEFGCVKGDHGSDSYRMPFIAVNDSFTRAYLGGPEQVSPLAVGVQWHELLAKFVEVNHVDVGEQQPQWWLVSWYGS